MQPIDMKLTYTHTHTHTQTQHFVLPHTTGCHVHSCYGELFMTRVTWVKSHCSCCHIANLGKLHAYVLIEKQQTDWLKAIIIADCWLITKSTEANSFLNPIQVCKSEGTQEQQSRRPSCRSIQTRRLPSLTSTPPLYHQRLVLRLRTTAVERC